MNQFFPSTVESVVGRFSDGSSESFIVITDAAARAAASACKKLVAMDFGFMNLPLSISALTYVTQFSVLKYAVSQRFDMERCGGRLDKIAN